MKKVEQDDRMVKADDFAYEVGIWFIKGEVKGRLGNPELAVFSPGKGWECIDGLRIARLYVCPEGIDIEKVMLDDEPFDRLTEVPSDEWSRVGELASSSRRPIVAILVPDDSAMREAQTFTYERDLS